ncbi:(d)CMP kinase [Hathewaya limosa]|uniref:Cytidylate kinase n=1 Tax=Hathewaya limosa TaxID=1536 RepID=A0ABU0JU25_HATLI|nr:(d)CMP kinase [Hathewaya limosa]AWZ48479.1 (d)CMP kinase [Clostridiaceae bacterium 14S0207]MDQ0480604.1 cytidylate kinase [Hathewaya limosa]
MKYNVAIDGPAGAGKSTIAKLLGKRLDLMYINTGAMYRAIAMRALENNISETDDENLKELIDKTDISFEGDHLILNGENVQDKITTPYISNNVSKYAANKCVRERLVKLQQKIAENYNVIMDGRDIGTVVLKDAPYKFFLTASAEERANRRYKEFLSKNIEVSFDEILKDIIERDNYDTTREVDPLRMAEDAIEINSTGKTIEEVINEMEQHIAKEA